MSTAQPRLNLSKRQIIRPRNLAVPAQPFNFLQDPAPVETGQSLTLLKREIGDTKSAVPVTFPFTSNEVIVLDDDSSSDAFEIIVPPPPKRKRTPSPAEKSRVQDIDLGAESEVSEESTIHSDDSLLDFVVPDDAPEPPSKKRRIWRTPPQSQTELLDEGLAEVQDETPEERLEKTLFG